MREMLLEIAWTQHRGSHRRQEDALWNCAAVLQEGDLPPRVRRLEARCTAVAVADGVAVSPAPHEASRALLLALARHLDAGTALDSNLLRGIHGEFCEALGGAATRGSATTLAAVCVEDGACAVLNVGDSRVYRLDAAGGLTQLSRDHTMRSRMLDRGIAAGGREHGTLYRMLYSCIVADRAENDFAIFRTRAALAPGESLLLCTDGVHDTLGDPALQALLAAAGTPAARAGACREAVLAAGAPDNFSLVLVQRLA